MVKCSLTYRSLRYRTSIMMLDIRVDHLSAKSLTVLNCR